MADAMSNAFNNGRFMGSELLTGIRFFDAAPLNLRRLYFQS